MAISQYRAKRSPTGSKYKKCRKKKQFELGSSPTLTKVGGLKKKQARIIGGNKKQRLLSTDIANVYDPVTKKAFKAKILDVISNPANRYFIRRDIITKGSIVSTDKGNARVTSRPGQEGAVNAVLVKQ